MAVGLVAGCTLALQVVLTRLLSAVLFYHFSFLAISLALLGVGGGAIVVYVRPGWFAGRELERVLAGWCMAFAALTVAVPLALVRLDYAFGTQITLGFALNLAAACALAGLPFAAAGIVIALAVRGYTPWIGRLYAFDLAGAGLGALAVVPLLWLADAPTLLVALGAVAAAAAVMFAGRARPHAAAAAALTLVAVALTAASAATSLYHLPPRTGAPPGLRPVSDTWTPLSRVLGYPPPEGSSFALVFYDRIYAPVPLHRRGAPPVGWRTLHLGPQSIGYALTGPGRALVIGGGGGRDILNALAAGQRRVDVIELNRAIRDTVDHDLRRWSGAPYSLPRVHTAIGDGRSTLAARGTRYDQIHIGFTDTLSANSAQGFALSEANLYTVEAFQEYFDHLRPGGILNVTRLYHLAGDEALRTTVLALEALRERGVAEPRRHVVVLLGRDIFNELFGTVLVRLRPFSGPQLVRIRRLAAQRGEGVAFAPGGPYFREWGDLARAASPGAFCAGYRLNVCAPTDDKPFFFNMKRLDDVGRALPAGYIVAVDPMLVLLVTLAILGVLSLLAFVLPLAAVRKAERPPASSLLFFAAIGLGFLLLEIVLIQRFVLFLGFPTYALSVVLFALLCFTGLGSLLTQRWRTAKPGVATALGAACVLIAASAFGLQPLLRELLGAPFALRVALTIAMLAPVGLLLGTAMPMGLRRLSGLSPGAVPWAWGINGVASVLASVLAVAVAINWGFTAVSLLALACYLGALAHVLLGRWPAPAPAPRARDAAPAPAPLAASYSSAEE
jgi:hypothetical protein